MKFTRSNNQVGPKEACMNEGGEGTRQGSSVAPTGTSSSPALKPASACVGPGHEMSGAAGRTLTAQPTCNRARAAAYRAGGARRRIDVAPPRPSGLRWGRRQLPPKRKN